MIEAAVDQGVIVRPPMLYGNIEYRGACDPAGGSGQDSFTAAVSHVDNINDVVLDNLLEIRPPYSPTAAVDQAAAMFKSYGLNSCTGDAYSALWCVEAFAKVGIKYEHSERNRSEIYLDCLPLFTSGRARILDNKRLINQFASLERKTSSVGKDRVNHGVGGHDDAANAAALAMVLAETPAKEGPTLLFSSVAPAGTYGSHAVYSSDPDSYSGVQDNSASRNDGFVYGKMR
jgi:hypothetical protein